MYHHQHRVLFRQVAASLTMALVTIRPSLTFAENIPDSSIERMQMLAQQTEVQRIDQNGSEQPARFLPQPVFRYSDQPRFIHDATLWVWIDEDDRPVAVQKIEDSQQQGTGQRQWTHCFASLAQDTIRVQWPEGRSFQTRSPGLQFRSLAEAPAPAQSGRSRHRQLRELSRQFAATIINNPKTGDKLEMRLLPRPIFEFGAKDSTAPSGAIFGFATAGTNPDLLLVIELRADEHRQMVWQFAAARMTTGGLSLRHHEEPVWSADWIRPTPQPMDTWTFFFVPQSDE